jgi:hypothetical protein
LWHTGIQQRIDNGVARGVKVEQSAVDGIVTLTILIERSRDRGGGYGEAASKALPGAIQIADRWHLMENASATFLDAVRKSIRSIRSALGGDDQSGFAHLRGEAAV